MFLRAGGVCVTLILPAVGLAANVTVNVSSNLVTVCGAVFGMGTAIYDNINGDPALPGRIMASGVNTLRYSGGGLADIFHWSISQPSLDTIYGNYGTTPWWGVTNNYSYLGSQTDFGNFVHLLDQAHAQAVITVDYGSGQQWDSTHTKLVAPFTNSQPQEAAAWVAYANGDASLYGTPNDITIGVDVLGNDWKTVGFWAKLRSSTLAQYQAWAGTADHLSDYNFLAINHPAPVGIKFWEIGNETFGTGYYDGSTNGYSVNYTAPYTGTSRFGIESLSPAVYGQQVKAFSLAMKAVDPTIKIGAVVSTPPGDYSWDNFNNTGERWIPQVLSQCATDVDFVIAHWYPTASGSGSSLLSGVRTTIPLMINGVTPGLDTDTSAGLRDWINTYRPTDGTNVQIFITEFGYMGSLSSSVVGPVNALFCADSYATWMDLGVANIDWLELNKTTFLGDTYGALANGAAYYAIQMVHDMAGVGDTMVATTSDASTIRAHAALQQSGKLGLLLINESRTSTQTVNVAVSSLSLSNSGTQYQLATNNFTSGSVVPTTSPSSNTVSGLGNAFSVTLPPYSMTVLVIPSLTNNSAPVLAPISNQTVNVGQTVAFTASATDTDLPPQKLTFSLAVGPGNATLDTNTGAFSWRPLVTQANTTNPFALKVADNGMPGLSATQSFNVMVNPLALPSLSSVVLSNGQITFLMGGGQIGPDYAVQVSTNLFDWRTLYITNSTGSPLQLPDTNAATAPAQFYRVKVGPPLP